jgi:hypothetical protein
MSAVFAIFMVLGRPELPGRKTGGFYLRNLLDFFMGRAASICCGFFFGYLTMKIWKSFGNLYGFFGNHNLDRDHMKSMSFSRIPLISWMIELIIFGIQFSIH